MNAAVLLVDDDRAFRKLIRAYLQEEGIGVVECATGEEAVELAREHRPALVLLDVRLPGIDGFEVLRRFEASRLELPVIMLTSLAEEVDQLVGFRLGAVDYVTKPVSPKLLAAKVRARRRRAICCWDIGTRPFRRGHALAGYAIPGRLASPSRRGPAG